VRTGDWKYVAAPTRELYDLARDPDETRNLAGERPQLADRLAAELETLAPESSGTPVAAPVDAATLERLRSLGYLGTGGGRGPASSEAGADPKDRIADYVTFVQDFHRAQADFDAGRLDRAARGFLALARRNPTSYEAHQYAGRALFALGRHRAALAEYEVTIGLNPEFAAGHFDAARAEAALGSFDPARARLARGLALEPDSFYGQMVRGFVDKSAGDLDGARASFERALELNPGMALAHFELGELAEARGDRGGAVGHYESALASDEDF
jgi:tetratricopeptide (TPR) repeat protein